MKFYKYHGLGNDFVLLDDSEIPAEFSGKMVQQLCDRHFGIGADGVLVVTLNPGKDMHGQMTMYNPDGSQAEMCGNGLRCVAFHMARHHKINAKEMKVITGAGVKICEVVGGNDTESTIKVDMGKIVFAHKDLPETGPEHYVELSVGSDDKVRVYPASAGNPHAIIKVNAEDDLKTVASHIGPIIESHEAFPNKTNVEFVKEKDSKTYDVIVYERGAGLTLACGSGATATAAVAVKHWYAPLNTDIQLNLPGGPLTMNVSEDVNVLMTGPATFVFSGKWQW